MIGFDYTVNSIIINKDTLFFGDRTEPTRQFGGVVVNLEQCKNDFEFIQMILDGNELLASQIREDGATISNKNEITAKTGVLGMMLRYEKIKKEGKEPNQSLVRVFKKYEKSDIGLRIDRSAEGFDTSLVLDGMSVRFGEPKKNVYASLLDFSDKYNKYVITKKNDGFNPINEGGYVGKTNSSKFKF